MYHQVLRCNCVFIIKFVKIVFALLIPSSLTRTLLTSLLMHLLLPKSLLFFFIAKDSLYIYLHLLSNFLYKLSYALSLLHSLLFLLLSLLNYLFAGLKCVPFLLFQPPLSTTSFYCLAIDTFRFSKNFFFYSSNNVRHCISHKITIFFYGAVAYFTILFSHKRQYSPFNSTI